ncbi:hypothetical protein CERSUDRAFT_100573 [Gelatoporia subvermispora B]|uniref:DUF6534 domain-containing protein n=1 Tax=Ceriporiopsis subvermispora (strain B) TaxID=914234 RepID=M2Q349_CERS8|nr:hypothetical protein CERSUDRAFT_100573 [Gelatoporia subvermispora B]
MALRYAICALWILDTAHQVFVTHTVYTMVITRWCSVSVLSATPWSVLAGIVVTSISNFAVRTVFGNRLFRLSGNSYFIIAPNVLGNLLSLAGYLVFVIRASPLTLFQFGTVNWSLYMGIAAGFAADIWLAACFIVILAKSRTGFTRTDSILRTLMIYCVNTTLITSICEMMTVISFAVLSKTSIDYVFFVLSPKLLFNSLLATYNARQEMRETAHGSDDLISVHLSRSPQVLIADTYNLTSTPISSVHIGKKTDPNVYGLRHIAEANHVPE